MHPSPGSDKLPSRRSNLMSKTDEFEEQLLRDGYLDVKHRLLECGEDTQPHNHDFDTRLLVLEGEMTVVCGGTERCYRAGEILEIPAGAEHCERYGAGRLRFVAGLRRKVLSPEQRPR